MKKLLVLTSLAITGILFSTCDRKEEDKTPVACFTPSKTEASTGELIAFNNCSEDADTYSWNFGDGSSTSTEVSPSHSFTAAGQYPVTLRAWYKNNVDEERIIITITGGNTNQPVACINPSARNVETGISITFNNCSVDATTFSWNFGDGSTSTSASPSHSYSSAGTFTVELTAYNGDKSDTETVDIVVTNPGGTDPVACFTLDATTAAVNQYIYTTNCSQNATSYEWDLEDNGTVESTDASPVIYYTAEGTYTIRLTAINGSKRNSTTKVVEIVDCQTDPTSYDFCTSWTPHYTNDFSASGDWSEETTADYSSLITGGQYQITNMHAENSWFFWTNNAAMPSSAMNFDFEIYFKLEYDNVTVGDGLFWGLDPDAFKYYYYRLTSYESAGWYIIGDNTNGSWLSGDGWAVGGDINNYNKLTVRKYNDKYYFFMNEALVHTQNYAADFGEKFGFYVGPNSKMSIEWIGIWTMSNKKAGVAGENPGKQMLYLQAKKGNGMVKALKVDQAKLSN